VDESDVGRLDVTAGGWVPDGDDVTCLGDPGNRREAAGDGVACQRVV
jgi:hypothetical protein